MPVLEFEITRSGTKLVKVAKAVEKATGLPPMFIFAGRSVPGLQQPDIINGYVPTNHSWTFAYRGGGFPDMNIRCLTSPTNNWEPTDTYKIIVNNDVVTGPKDQIEKAVMENLKPWWQKLGENLYSNFEGLPTEEIARILHPRQWWPHI